MPLPSDLLSELQDMPRQLEQTLRLVPSDRTVWKHQLRIRRMLDESNPSLESLDGYEIARERRYEAEDLDAALAAFRNARAVPAQPRSATPGRNPVAGGEDRISPMREPTWGESS